MNSGEGVLTVSELTRGIRRILESSFPQILVRGEVVGVSRPQSGHIYFSLRDRGPSAEAQIAVVAFRDEVSRFRFRIEDGLRVIVRGRLGVYEPRGQYQIIAHGVEPDGLGEMALAFEQLKRRLAAEGLFAQERKRPLPRLPGRIGIVTSPSGAAIHDILRSIFRRQPKAWVRIVPVRVQGEGAAEEIQAALEFLGGPGGGVDVIILGRGGGSPEDLWTFNEERVVRAVASCPVPTISAVGHEVDFTLTDFAADVRAQTPTHAGELVVSDVSELRRRLSDWSGRLGEALRRSLGRGEEQLRRFSSSWVVRTPLDMVGRRAQRLDDLGRNLKKSLYNTYTRWQDAVFIYSGKLNALNPLEVLRRGYSVVFNSQGSVVRRAEDLCAREEVRILLGKGEARATVVGIEDDHGR